MSLTVYPTIAMSDYPASSDPASQMQVLSEKKGELAGQMQDIEEDGSLDENQKQAMTAHLQQESNDVSVRIRAEQHKKTDEKLLADKREQDKRVEQKQLEKQQFDASRFDIRA